MENGLQAFKSELTDINSLYKKVKEVLILAENIDGKILVAPLNELRNALDHIMRLTTTFLENPDSIPATSKEFPKIKEHFLRAGYDGYELMALTLIDNIQSSGIVEFDQSEILQFYPTYTKDKTTILGIKKRLQEIRANKQPDNVEKWSPDNDFEKYLADINILAGIYGTINEHFNTLINEIIAIQSRSNIDILSRAIPKYAEINTEFLEIKADNDFTKLDRLAQIHKIFALNDGGLKIEKIKWWSKEIWKGVFIGLFVGIFLGSLFMYLKKEGPFKDNQPPTTTQDSTKIAKP
jgi:hypothetical protein